MTQQAKIVGPGYRIRDLTAGVVVLVIGAAMIHTVSTEGGGQSVTFTRWAFLAGGTVLMLAYGSGLLLDRIGKKFPSLVQRRDSPLPLAIVISVAVTAIGYSIYGARHWILPLLDPLINS